MTFGLTKRQADTLAFIRSYMAESGGVSPSYAEIATTLGLHSKSAVHKLVHGLVERGAVMIIPGLKRTITIIKAAA